MKMAEELRRRTIKNFMDILILTEINNHPLSGYDIIGLIHEKYGILMSSGTVYSLLYSMERDGLIQGIQNQRKRAYILTEKGKQNIEVITKANSKIQGFIRNMSLLSG